MKAEIDDLKKRRELLISQAATQREEVSAVSSHLKRRYRLVDTGFAIVKAIRTNPVLAVTSATLLFPASRNKLLRWSGRLFTAWELVRLVRKHWPVSKQQMESRSGKFPPQDGE